MQCLLIVVTGVLCTIINCLENNSGLSDSENVASNGMEKGIFDIFFPRENQQALKTFTIDYQNNTFLKDGQKFQYVAGSFHYFRTPPQKWRNILRSMRSGGLNVVQT